MNREAASAIAVTAPRMQLGDEPAEERLPPIRRMSRTARQEPAAAQEPAADLQQLRQQDDAARNQELMGRINQPLPSDPLARLAYPPALDARFDRPERFTDKQFGQYPSNAQIDYGARTLTSVLWDGRLYAWAAPDFHHRPLYFQNENLERYGIHYGCLQPLQSAAHFFVSTASMSFQRGLHPPCEHCYSLGYYRPGSCVPAYLSDVPVTVGAVLHQSLSFGAAVTIIP